MYHAARDGNWLLAAYQLRAIRKLFTTSKLTRPKYAQAMDEFAERHLAPLARAIEAKDWTGFSAASAAAIAASDEYHRTWGYGYILYRVSADPRRAVPAGAPGEGLTTGRCHGRMRFEGSIEARVSPARAWALLNDPGALATVLPGLESLDAGGLGHPPGDDRGHRRADRRPIRVRGPHRRAASRPGHGGGGGRDGGRDPDAAWTPGSPWG